MLKRIQDAQRRERRGAARSPKLSLRFAAAALLFGLGAAPAHAVLRSQSISCGNTVCTDVWKIDCGASSIVSARVRDTFGNDDTLMVTLLANTPNSIKGQAEVEVGDVPGAFSGSSVLFAPAQTTISAFAVVTNLSATASGYEIQLDCLKSNGGLGQAKVIKLLQDR